MNTKIMKISNILFHWSDRAARYEWAPALLARVSVGAMFMSSGWGKLHRLPEFTAFFESLGIPAASVQAPAIATLELCGGTALFLGLGARAFAALLASTMVVALATDKLRDPKNHALGNLFYLPEWLLLCLLLWIAFAGAGRLSVDHVLRKKLASPPAPGS